MFVIMLVVEGETKAGELRVRVYCRNPFYYSTDKHCVKHHVRVIGNGPWLWERSIPASEGIGTSQINWSRKQHRTSTAHADPNASRDTCPKLPLLLKTCRSRHHERSQHLPLEDPTE